jgi:dATP pyrophosphohydrolase
MPRIAADYVDVWLWRGQGRLAEFLLLRRAGDEPTAGLWLPVMGRIEPGETAARAAIRETREETGLTPAQLYQIDPVHTFFLAATDTIQMTPVFAAPVPTDAAVVLSQEHDAFRWLSAERASAEVAWPGQRAGLERVMADIVSGSVIRGALRVKW